MIQARFQTIIWREAPKKTFLHNLSQNNILLLQAAKYFLHPPFVTEKKAPSGRKSAIFNHVHPIETSGLFTWKFAKAYGHILQIPNDCRP